MSRHFWSFKATTCINTHIHNYSAFFMCSTMVSVTTTGALFFPFMAPIATSQRLNAFKSDFSWMVDVKILWFKVFCKRRNFVIELSKTFTWAPNPKAVLARYSPTVPAPMITTLVGGTPVIFPKSKPYLYSHQSLIRSN